MSRARSLAAAGLSLLGLAACGGPDRGKAYVVAYAAGEAAVGSGHFAEGAARFEEAARVAKVPRDADHARYLAARALERSGDRADAALLLQAIADRSPPPEDAAAAAYAICEMQIERGDGESEQSSARSTPDESGWDALIDMARRFPSSGVARRALRRAIAHRDQRDGVRETLAFIERLAPTLDGTELAQTVAYEAALHLAAVGDDARARDAFVALADRWPYPHGSFWDDALYRASLLDEKLGRLQDATGDLSRMLAERTSSWIMGTYERPRYEPAMVRLCALYRDRLEDHARARGCFDQLYREFTTSELRDDALWEEARLSRDDGDAASACSRLDTLVHDFPDSRYVPCAAAECPRIVRPSKSGAPLECHPYIARFRLGSEPPP